MNFKVLLTGPDFADALLQIKKFHRGKKPLDLVLTFKDKIMTLETNMIKSVDVIAKLTLQISGKGTADVRILLPGRDMAEMHGTFSSTAKLRFFLKDSCLHINRFVMPCKVLN